MSALSHRLFQNGSKDSSLDMLGTDIWAANTFDSFSGATWDLQPEKLDLTQFHRKVRHTPKQPLPHIDREGFPAACVSMEGQKSEKAVALETMLAAVTQLVCSHLLPSKAAGLGEI
ncbi:hypothetical protein P7K49_028115 [Saguinus oedipus]|uniref:Uncharacterized protein n=1 Tax=Saguinus oedipus TaxID=9490 RepID=A0ABQ9UBC9_SAGOE|nr:hypothetical protein P7K49_028115 [Saguinus oedipus]